MEIFKLFGSVLIDSSKAEESLSKTDKKAEGLGTRLGEGIKTAAKWGAALGGAAVAVGGAMLGVANKAAEVTDRIDKLSQKIGLSRQGFQEWDYVLSQSGVDIGVLQGGFKAFTNQIDEASKGTKKSVGYFQELGVSLTDNEGKLKTQEQLFNETVKALQGMEEGPKKAALANDLLGRSASELSPVLNGTSETVDQLTKRAHELGLVMGDEAIDAGVLFGDTMDDVKKTFGILGTQIGIAFLPILQSLLEWILLHMPQIKAAFKAVFDVIGDVVSVMIRLWKFVEPTFPLIATVIGGAFKIVIDIVNEVISVFEKVTRVISGAIDMLKSFTSASSSVSAPDSAMGIDYNPSYYASGTNSAKKGWAWVGEQGPELVKFKGGEQVLSNAESMQGTVINQTINIQTTEATPSEVARAVKRASQDLAFSF